MIENIRQHYNRLFTPAAYESYTHALNHDLKYPADFRVCETPLFVSQDYRDQAIGAAESIIEVLKTPAYHTRSSAAIPPGCAVPNENGHPQMLQIDFAVCQDETGRLVPRLIELQGFPSLYCFQAFLDQTTRRHFWIPDGFSAYFGGLTMESYIAHLGEVIVGKSDPAHVILLEIDPTHQKTRIDFAATEQMIGIRSVDLRDVVKRGSKLFYQRDGVETPIERLYSRFIRDDPQFVALNSNLWLGEAVDAEWITHPNWFYRISKYSLPLLTGAGTCGAAVPETYFLSELTEYPTNLAQFVLKPLFLFSGAGVELEVTAERLDAITHRENYILQRKVQYAPAIATPDGEFASVEVRLLFTWEGSHPRLVCNLVRMSKGKMMGVRFNRDKTWVGSSVGYFPTI
jgi:hypothetical protein